MERIDGTEVWKRAMMDALGASIERIEVHGLAAATTAVEELLTLDSGLEVQVFVEAAVFDRALLDEEPLTGGLLKHEHGQVEALEGRLVLLPGGRDWDVLTDAGHAGLPERLRQWRGRLVCITIDAIGRLEDPEEDEVEALGGPLAFERLDGVGPEVAQVLAERFGDWIELMAASDEEILAVPGVGEVTLARIREQLAEAAT